MNQRLLVKGGKRKLAEDSFSVGDLGIAIARVLQLKNGEIVEIQKDKTNANRVLVLRHPAEEEEQKERC